MPFADACEHRKWLRKVASLHRLPGKKARVGINPSQTVLVDRDRPAPLP
jgi:hypothetical protein